jgi:hypothetical protein
VIVTFGTETWRPSKVLINRKDLVANSFWTYETKHWVWQWPFDSKIVFLVSNNIGSCQRWNRHCGHAGKQVQPLETSHFWLQNGWAVETSFWRLASWPSSFVSDYGWCRWLYATDGRPATTLLNNYDHIRDTVLVWISEILLQGYPDVLQIN